MPKVHKRAVSSRHYHDYTEETLNKCLSDIKNKVMIQRNAAKAYNIPRRTINYKLKETRTKSIGRPNAFSEARPIEIFGAKYSQNTVLLKGTNTIIFSYTKKS